MPSPVLPLLLLLGGGAALAVSKRNASPSTPAPAGSLDPNLPVAVAQQVLAALATGTDPNALETAATALAAQGYPLAAAALRAKAMMLRAAMSAPGALQNVAQVLSPGFVPPPSPTVAETHATAQQVLTQATQTAASSPGTTTAATQAAQAATTAAQAASTGNPATAVAAAQQAAQAAQTAMSQPAAVQAAQAAQTAIQAAATNNPVLAQQAANQAVQAAQTAILSTTAAAQSQPAPTPTTSLDPNLVHLATIAAAEIRSKGCWKEDRSKIQAYQAARGGTATMPGYAGTADGMYGPKTALDMMTFLPKVPAPCYWPSAAAAKTQAQKDWANLISTGKVTVGSLGQNPIFVGALARYHSASRNA